MNIFADIPETFDEELIETLVEGENVKMERIVSYGQVSPEGFWYDQPQHEWVVVLEGCAEVEFAEKKVRLECGDTLLIEAHERHRVSFTCKERKTVWLALFFS